MKSPALSRRSAFQVAFVAHLSCVCLLLALCGCPRSEPGSGEKPAKRALEGVTLKLAVVDDPAMAAAITKLRGEWNAQTGAELQLTEMTEKELLRADMLPTDALLCPSHMLGDLAERKLIAPVPPKMLHSEAWGEVFELLKLREAAWGKEIMAVPFGSPVFCCYYRADLLKDLGRRPPKTWAEYQELAAILRDRFAQKTVLASDHPWSGTLEPLAPGWAGLTLLARAASYAKHRDNYSTLFDIETMAPLVAGPPMVRALEELVAANKLGSADSRQRDPASVRAAFWRGECGMAITWPTAAERREERGEKKGTTDYTPGKVDTAVRVGFVELPGSPKVFNVATNSWNDRADDENRHVPLLSIAGRLGVVSAKSERKQAAFQLLLWLSSGQTSPLVSAASPATTLFRKSNLKSPSRWVEKPVSAPAAVKYADVTETALQHEQWLGALRLPGRAEYLAALDDAVTAAVSGKKSPRDALLEADAQWRKITKQLGLDRQKAAYRHSLGLE